MRYHVLLIGCDAYPSPYNSLSGCVNDIDAIESLLLDPPGVGIPVGQIAITRLAAALAGTQSTSKLVAKTDAPIKRNIVHALEWLASDEVGASDRVLVYYSGHGDQARWQGTSFWHEAIVPVDVDYIYDIELNALVHAIADRTSDVTVVLDSCHSGGATRSLGGAAAQGADRLLRGGSPSPPPSGSVSIGQLERSSAGRLLHGLDPQYLAVAACQPGERAGEGGIGNEVTHGILTYGLLSLLRDETSERRAEMRWADVWPALVDNVDARCFRLARAAQLPALLGRSERRIFGGAWHLQDPGYPVRANADGTWTIGAGQLTGVTAEAVFAVYGAEPAQFPELDTADDHNARLGTIRILSADRSSAIARADNGAAFHLLAGARARLVKAGRNERLRVLLEPVDPAVVQALEQSNFLEVAGAAAEVKVTGRDGDWVISNEVEPQIAVVPASAPLFALRAGLESYARQNIVLRLAQRSNDPELRRCLTVRLLDCGNTRLLSAANLAAPDLPEVKRNGDRLYELSAGTCFCVRLINTHLQPLFVYVFNCAAAGQVELLGELVVGGGDQQVLWQGSKVGQPFCSTVELARWVTDRLVVIGTTKKRVELKQLAFDETVQRVVDAQTPSRTTRGRGVTGGQPPAAAAPMELWTAVVQPMRIGPATQSGGDE